MDLDCLDWITENLHALEESDADDCKYIYGIYLLLCDVENDGLAGYLTGSAADHFSSVANAFKALNFSEGNIFVKSLEEFFGGTVPVDQDERIDQVLPFLKSRDEGPVDRLSNSVDRIVPALEEILRCLVATRRHQQSFGPLRV